MTRSRSGLAVAVATLALLAGCSSGAASQSDVQDKVEDLLTDNGGFPDQDGNLTELNATEVGAVSACVSQGLFDPQQFSKDERNEVSSAVDSELPPTELVERFEALVDDCVTDATEGEAQGPSVDDDDEDQTSNDDDTTTTTD